MAEAGLKFEQSVHPVQNKPMTLKSVQTLEQVCSTRLVLNKTTASTSERIHKNRNRIVIEMLVILTEVNDHQQCIADLSKTRQIAFNLRLAIRTTVKSCLAVGSHFVKQEFWEMCTKVERN